MFLSAVSALVLATTSLSQPQRDLSARELAEWRHLQPSMVTIVEKGVPEGTAGLISSSGLFLIHQSQVPTPLLDGVLSSGRSIQLEAIARDPVTHLDLLQALNWRPEYGIPLRVPRGDERGHGVVFAVLPTGPIRAVFTGLHRTGFMHRERRILPFNEVRFELPPQACAGALLVDEDAELLGVLGATLSTRPLAQFSDGTESTRSRLLPSNGYPGMPIAPPSIANDTTPGISSGRAETSSEPQLYQDAVGNLMRRRRTMGPSELTVAYSAGVVVMRRVVLGFLSPEHRVDYPSLGVLCKDTGDGGSFIQEVEAGSSAERAGLQAGDSILAIGGEPVRNQVEFALVMLNQEVGSEITIKVRHWGRIFLRQVVVGRG